MSTHSRNFHTFLFLFSTLFMISLIISTSACTFLMGEDTSLKETNDVLSIEGTLNAFSAATLIAQETEGNFQATIDSLQLTNDAQATSFTNPSTQAPVQTEIPTDIVTPNLQPTQTDPEASPILITEWKMLYWRPLSSGCHLEDLMCWKLFDDFKTTGGPADAVLTSKTPVLIEENWLSPYLVFWHEHELKYEAKINLHVNGTPITVKDYTKSKGIWKQNYVDLKDYKGKNVVIQFISRVGERHINTWFIQEVQIVPDFTPPQ